MPRFAILDHDYPFPHWDFLIESGGVLRAWRLHAEPVQGTPIRADPLPDHRLIYLDYEGPISGDRGRVIRWDAGTVVCEEDRENEIRLRLTGDRIVGAATLRRDDGGWTWEWR